MKVNRWNDRTVERHIDQAFDAWDHRNRHNWTLDLSMLTAGGVALAEPPGAEQRRDVATQTLRSSSSCDEAPASTASAPATATATATATPGQGWFPDPVGRYQYRWWTGAAWTADVAIDGVPTRDPL